MDPKQRQFSIWYMFIALWVLMLIQMFLPSFFNPTEIPYSEFKEAVAKGDVTEISVSTHIIHGKMKEDKSFNTIRIEDPDLVRDLAQRQVKVTGVIESTLVRDLLSWIVPIALFFGVWWFLLRRMGQSQGFMTVGQSKAKIYVEKEVKVTFADVAGVDEAKQELEEIIEFLKTPEKFRRLGGKIPKGSCLWGRQEPEHSWRRPWPAKPAYRFFRSAARNLWRCSSGSALPACATCSSRPKVKHPASSSSTSSMRLEKRAASGRWSMKSANKH